MKPPVPMSLKKVRASNFNNLARQMSKDGLTGGLGLKVSWTGRTNNSSSLTFANDESTVIHTTNTNINSGPYGES